MKDRSSRTRRQSVSPGGVRPGGTSVVFPEFLSNSLSSQAIQEFSVCTSKYPFEVLLVFLNCIMIQIAECLNSDDCAGAAAVSLLAAH